MDSIDPQWLLSLAASPLTLGFLVFGVVATIKRDAERRKPPINWNPWLWRGIAAVVGMVLSLVLHAATGAATLLTTGWPGAAAFGLVAAAFSVFGRDGLKTLLGWLGTAGSAVAVDKANEVNVQVETKGEAQ